MNTIGVIANLDKPGTRALLPGLEKRAARFGLTLRFDASCADALPETECRGGDEVFAESEALMTLGGDGTLLGALRRMGDRPVPILGVNFGKLGFLTSVTHEEVDEALEALATDGALPSRRRLLECRPSRPGLTDNARALNDVVLGWGTSSHLARLNVRVDDRHVTTYSCDGIILSTPTGSTGHSLSAGGPILVPDSNDLVLSPICSHSMTVRPVVLPSSAHIRFELDAESKSLVLACDGQSLGELQPGDTLDVHLGSVAIDLLHLPDYDYWEILRNKLHWRGSAVG